MTLATAPIEPAPVPPAPPSDLVARDAREFGAYARTGGWAFALRVARSVRPGGQGAGETPKVAAKAFEELTFDDAQEYYEDDMVQRLGGLQRAIGSCLTALRGVREGRPGD